MISDRVLAHLALGLLGLAASTAAAATLPAFTIEDLVRVRRVEQPVVSGDGRLVAFVVRETQLEANRRRAHLWVLDLGAPNATPRQLTGAGSNDFDPHWSGDGRVLYFLSTRSGSTQVWRIALQGGEAQQVTHVPLDVTSLEVAPLGERIAFSMEVVAGCKDLQCSHDRLAAPTGGQASGMLFDQLFVRHWDTWSRSRSHLFTARVREDGTAEEPVDVSRLDADVPSKPFGDEADYDFSPDGRRIVFSARLGGSEEARSTNFDLYEVPADGSAAPRNLTADHPAWDGSPKFLPNGDLTWLAQDRPGYESDRFHIMIRDSRTGATRPLTAGWDRSVAHLERTASGHELLASVDELGQQALYAVDPRSGRVRRLVGTGQVTAFSSGGRELVVAWASLGAPPDLYRVPLGGGGLQRLTQMNAELLAARSLSPFEQFSFAGWHGERVYGYVVKPHGFQAGARYPVAFVIHGGPQSSMGNEWSYRWNPQVFAGAGYGVVFIDFHGSPGYGQAFTDSINQDWGGKPLEDLQKGLAAALERYPWLDGERTCALGASYGGFMIDWIAGRWPARFRCLVSHDGVFDQRSMYYSTEELWFPEWENGGAYYEKPQNYERFNPADYVTQWRTPMLVIHSGQDFRVPLSQGLGAFTALQRRGIESRLLYFPDENHWVLKPANSIQWYHVVLGWLDSHLH
ncbi:MAG TPA: S9 family peptidase [Steroidobacteraceae bacterium]|nr:S9 family peptidase [Steroidobacteraceae bacterium]